MKLVGVKKFRNKATFLLYRAINLNKVVRLGENVL
jgi:hypothetical protein